MKEASFAIEVQREPSLRFGFGQSSTDPKSGLFLFGPLREKNNPTEIRSGVIGTSAGIHSYRGWVERIAKPIPAVDGSKASVFYPGFKELFNCGWPRPVAELQISAVDILTTIHRADRHEAVHATVSLFSRAISDFLRDDDKRVDIWFIVIPDDIFNFGRPRSRVPLSERVPTTQPMNSKLARRLMREPSLFAEDMLAAEPYLYQVDFHNQLKARLIQARAITQVIRESTLAHDQQVIARRRLQDVATIAWNLSVSSFYKAGGRPWRLQDVRSGVCYVGLVFKRDDRNGDPNYACCGAQMFLTTGEGMVFKGVPGPWYSPLHREFHLSKEQAFELGSRIISAYQAEMGEPPKELFLHGRTRFAPEEWQGFLEAMPKGTSICGVRITRSDEFKLYRPGRMPVIRGTTLIQSSELAYLWTSGFVPELETYPGWEVPNPLRIEISRGNGQISNVARDVLQLTKLNFNACVYGDGLPVTLRFADAVGEILTAAPATDIPEAPLPFRHYI